MKTTTITAQTFTDQFTNDAAIIKDDERNAVESKPRLAIPVGAK